MQKKPKTVEAVLFFNEQGGICTQMLYPEFEALLDGVVNMPSYVGKQVRMVHLSINPRLKIRSVVCFLLEFDESGRPDKSWNIPLQHLAERAGRGPDLGAGPIRLACRSQCPVSWHQSHLWDPNMAPGKNHLTAAREAITRNTLGLLVEDEASVAPSAAELQVSGEENWHIADSPRAGDPDALELAEKINQEQRVKAAQLIKQQRLRITSLTKQYEEELAKLKFASADFSAEQQEKVRLAEESLQQQVELNVALKAQLAIQAATFQASREELTEQLNRLERDDKSSTAALRKQFESEIKARINTAVVEYQEQIASLQKNLKRAEQKNTKLQAEQQRLQHELEHASSQTGEQVLERLAKLGVVFVVYHPGAGHLTIPLKDITHYQRNTMAYVAAKCFVGEDQYRQWLEHYQQPCCVALLPSGERCSIPIDRVDSPSRFVADESNCCARHMVASRMQTTG
jgi:hypothetical protein